MSGDNPFAEPGDSDRTVFIPAPGGRGMAPPPPASPLASPLAAAAAGAAGPDLVAAGQTPLLAAASPLLALLSRLRNTVRPPDSADLRERTLAALRRFEAAARGAAVADDLLRPAHYALCAAIDDVVLATPWGAESDWTARSLVSTCHGQTRSGEGFYHALRQLATAPGGNLPVLELMYRCLSLGFVGQYRLMANGPAEFERTRETLYALIARTRGAADPALSLSWRGVAAPYRKRRAEVPLWVAAVAGLALVGFVYAALLLGLSRRADTLYAALAAAPPASMPALQRAAPAVPPPAPPASGALDNLAAFLAPEIAAHEVVVLGTEAAPVVRITSPTLFASGSAAVNTALYGLLDRIGAALKTEPGKVVVRGYTDAQPIHTLAFPSNLALSEARALAAAGRIAAAEGHTDRFAAQGLGDADPIAPNTTAAGRQQNRRIDIVLQRAD